MIKYVILKFNGEKGKNEKYRFFILHSVWEFESILRITNKITELGEKKS